MTGKRLSLRAPRSAADPHPWDRGELATARGRDRGLTGPPARSGRTAAGGRGWGEVIARDHRPGNHDYMSTQKQGDAPSPPDQIRGWLTRRLPGDWFEGAPEILTDREEITVIGHLPGPGTSAAAGGGKA